MNSYVIEVCKRRASATVFRGIVPFWFCMLATIFIVTVFPDIALFLPNLLHG
jgi:TRAP-type C4-dicarboxylate transport system permease large subunit